MTIRVLLADDHAVLRDGVRLLLEMDPKIKVVGDAGDGREAVRLALELTPDVAILDIIMPELNGIEAARQIIRETADTRVIILSMNANSEHIFRALRAGVSGYLLKASAGSEVADAVYTVAAGGRYLSQAISDAVISEYISQREATENENRLDRLSAREREVLQLVVEGHSNTEIATRLYITPGSVKTYRKRIMQKLEIHDLPGLVKFAIRHGVTPLE